MPNLIHTLLEVERLKRLDRTGWTLRGLPTGTESVAAHSFGVGVTAMLLADELIQCGVDLDVLRVLRMALLHDWAEVRTGDLPKTASEYFGAEARSLAESAAFAQIVCEAGSAANDYRELYHEYEERTTLESRIVKVADVVDLLVEALALEKAGARGLSEFWEIAENPEFQLEGIAQKVVKEIFDSLVKARSEIS